MRQRRTGFSIKRSLTPAIALLILASALVVEAQTLQTLCSFNKTNGAYPNVALTLGTDGNFCGTTFLGGSTDGGTVFKLTTNGTLTTLISFGGTNGIFPLAALTLGTDGNFYGTTSGGGSGGFGTVFKLTTNGTLTTLISFGGTNGASPDGALTLDTDGNFYGTTYYGGSSDDGTVFKLTTNGTLTTLISFGSTNGANPSAALTLGSDGNFYGTTYYGGSSDDGTVFKLTTNGTLTTLISFGSTNGANPSAALTLGSDGNFYGTTYYGGSSDDGTVFKLTTNGTLTTLISFGSTNGANPSAALTLGTDGNFYSTTLNGGSSDDGTVFKMTTNGTLTTLISFESTNGAGPLALTLGTDCGYYGITDYGGSSNAGTVFRLSVLPVITVQAQSQTTNAGATVTFFVSATSLTPMRYQWQKNGTNLIDGDNMFGATTSTFTITGISDSDAASYSVIVANSFGSAISSNAVLIVDDFLFIASQPQSQTVGLESNVTFNVTVYGAPPFIFQWYFNDTPLGSPEVGSTILTCTLTNCGTIQAGNYYVEVVNGYGSVTSSNAILTVAVPPVITTQPTNRTNKAGTTATFSVTASGLPMSYQWQMNGMNLVNGGKYAGVTTTILTITSVSSNEAAIYSVILTNPAGSATSSNATLTVIYPPAITTQPLGQRLVVGNGVVFDVAVSGTPPFLYQWQFNGSDLLNATNAAYAIQSVGATDTGNYSVVVTNLAGTVTSSNALLTVIVPPTLALEFLAGYPLLNLHGMLSSNFVVQYSTNLTSTNWSHLLSLTNLSSSPYLFLDPAGDAESARFYRAFMQ